MGTYKMNYQDETEFTQLCWNLLTNCATTEHTVFSLITNSGGTGSLVDFQHNFEFLKKFLDNKSAVQ